MHLDRQNATWDQTWSPLSLNNGTYKGHNLSL